jgi:hypothetical protein
MRMLIKERCVLVELFDQKENKPPLNSESWNLKMKTGES